MNDIYYCDGCNRDENDCICCIACGEPVCVCDRCDSQDWCECGRVDCPSVDHCLDCRNWIPNCTC